jgi:protein SCO1
MSKSPMFWIVSTVVALAAALVAALMTTRASDGDTSPVDESLPLMDSSAYEGMAIIPFRMVDQNGNSATEAMLDGHWTVMSFMFTHCVLACPQLQGNMYRLAESNTLRNEPVRFVSISVDPVHDTVERLNAYATDMGVDYDRWKLLRSDAVQIQNFMSSLGFVPPREDGSEANRIRLPDGSTMGNILHPNTFLVINPDGEVVGRYRGDDRDEVAQLAIDLRRAISQQR